MIVEINIIFLLYVKDRFIEKIDVRKYKKYYCCDYLDVSVTFAVVCVVLHLAM